MLANITQWIGGHLTIVVASLLAIMFTRFVSGIILKIITLVLVTYSLWFFVFRVHV